MTATAEGHPDSQDWDSFPGFLTGLDDRTLGFADVAGHHQDDTLGHLSENPKALLCLMDDANQQRVKVSDSHGPQPTHWRRAQRPLAPGLEALHACLADLEARVAHALDAGQAVA